MCESVLTQTRPWPPPAAGAALAVAARAVVARVAGAAVAAAGVADAEVFGLNKPPSMGLEGDAEGAGLAATSVFAFLCARGFAGDGDAAGDSAVEGDAAS
jgi:hypothetical protein